MLLGIAYHCALSFCLGAGWIVQDAMQSKALYIFQAFVHGFRMQLFMVLSGFFTAMLWRRRGLRAVLRQRFLRVFLPCMAALMTVVPAVVWASNFAAKARLERLQAAPHPPAEKADVWAAIIERNLQAFAGHLREADVLTRHHPRFKMTALAWASLAGSREMVAALLERGAEVNGRSPDGHTALHGAAFLGRAEVVELLIKSGADINARSNSGERPRQSASTSYAVVESMSRLLGMHVSREQVLEGRARILLRLDEAGAEGGQGEDVKPLKSGKAALSKLTHGRVFSVVWFLWFLVWLNLLFAVYALAAKRFEWKARAHPLVASQRSLVWLAPLTVIPAWFMRSGHGEFGPDTSMGILPMPHVLAYYAVFFSFGVLYFDADEAGGRLGAAWRWTLPVSLLLVFPAALGFATGILGGGEGLLPQACRHFIAVFLQTLFAWMMTFACMGMFRSVFARESDVVRYVSRASYWCYLAHLPLVIFMQAVVSPWAQSAALKFTAVSLTVLAALFLSYHSLVRRSVIGKFLNGRGIQP